jgi:hypothetical protein
VKTTLYVIAAIVLTGCVHVSQVRGPDGHDAYVLRCGDAEDCYKKAGELCPTGYAIIDQATGFAVVPTARGGAVGGSDHTMMMQCKGGA